MNVLRKHMAAEAEALKPLLDRAYHAIVRYQGDRTAANESLLRASLAPAIDKLGVFKPYMPAYKQAYFDVLLDDGLAMAPHDLIMLFDHCIDIMHLRLSRDIPAGEAGQPWSRSLLAALDRRLETPSMRPASGDFACSGVPASPGRATGIARVLRHDDEGQAVAAVQAGEIIVCQMSRTAWVEALGRVAALVTDRGGMACHAAIVAREFGVPCVAGCGDATAAIKTGDLIEVDGDLGIVTRVG